MRVLLALLRASSWKRKRNPLRRKGVRMRNIRFLGFLNVRRRFLWMSRDVWAMNPRLDSCRSDLWDDCEDWE